MSAPKFSTVSWLSQVTAADPEFYQWPVAYEFSRGRVFRKNDADWYAGLVSDIPDGAVMMGDDYVLMGDDYVLKGDG
jgi:hypothetical protein